MSWRAIAVLALAALLALGLALALPRTGGALAGRVHSGAPLLPRLAPRVDAVRAIRIAVSGRAPLLLEKRAQGWWLPAVDADADAALVATWLQRLAHAEVLAGKTRQPAQFPVLGLGPAGHGGAAIVLQFQGVAGVPALAIGHYDPRQDGTFVHLAGSDRALLVAGDLVPPLHAVDWMRHPLLQLPAGAVLQIDLSAPDGARLLVDRGLDGGLNLPIAPPGLAHPQALAGLLMQLFEQFDFSDLRAPQSTPAQALELRALLSDGSLISLWAWRDASGRAWCNLRIQAPASGLTPDAAAGLARNAERVQAHTWALAAGVYGLLHDALYPHAPTGDAPRSTP